jgi:hypothetical protein
VLILERAVAPLDAARSATLRLLCRSPLLTRVLARRDTRIAALGSAQVIALLGLTMRWPIAMYFIGPVVLGVAHLAADVRYLVFRLPLPRALVLVSAVLAVLLTVVRLCVGVHVASGALGARVDMVIGALWVGIALAVRFARSPSKLLLGAPLFLASAGLIVMHAPAVDLLLTHLHNVAAFVLWLSLYRRRAGWAALPVALAAVGAAILLSGVALPWTSQHGGLLAFGQRASRLASGFAPGLAPTSAMAITTTLVFLQSVHYAIWTGWIAQDCLPGQGTPTFRMTVRSLTADFGAVALGLILCTMVGFAAVACWQLRASVSWYMTVARAHVWFELAVFAFLVGRAHDAVASQPGPCDLDAPAVNVGAAQQAYA